MTEETRSTRGRIESFKRPTFLLFPSSPAQSSSASNSISTAITANKSLAILSNQDKVISSRHHQTLPPSATGNITITHYSNRYYHYPNICHSNVRSCLISYFIAHDIIILINSHHNYSSKSVNNLS